MYLILFKLALIFASLNLKESTDVIIHIDSTSNINKDSLVNHYCEIWKQDSTSCLKLRNANIALSLKFNYFDQNRTSQEIIEKLGKPNATFTNNEINPFTNKEQNLLILRYFFDAHCENQILSKSQKLSLCWLEVIID